MINVTVKIFIKQYEQTRQIVFFLPLALNMDSNCSTAEYQEINKLKSLEVAKFLQRW